MQRNDFIRMILLILNQFCLFILVSLCAAQLKEMAREDGSPFRFLYALNFLFKWIKYPLNKTVIVLKG